MKNPIIRLVFDHKKVATKTKEGLVQVQVYFNRERKYFSTGVRCYADQWSDKYHVRNRMDALQLNEQIELVMKRAIDTSNEVIRTSGGFSWDKFTELMKLDVAKADSFIDFIADRIGKRGNRESTQRQHWVFWQSLNDFKLIQTFNDLNLININKYEDWLRQKEIVQTTIYAYMKRFKIYVTEAVKFGLLEKNPFDGVHYDRGKPKGRKYLTESELKSLKNVELDSTLDKVRDVFLFMCYTALSYSDVQKFDYERDVFEQKGKKVFRDTRQKTDEEYFIVLIPQAIEILEKYECKLPVFANQRMNDYLKVIAKFAKIKKEITTHYARHTSACLALNNGVRIEAVSKMLGHSNIKTTQVYAKLLTDEVEQAYDKVASVWDNMDS
jgi:site-specific recombinase XerD